MLGGAVFKLLKKHLQMASGDLGKGFTSVALVGAIKDGPVPKAEREFRINGWRWHTKAVIRDLKRFEAVVRMGQKEAALTPTELTDQMARCHSFLCNFNWAALMRVERDIFYPWIRDILPEQSRALANEFTRSHITAKDLSQRLGREVELVRRANPDSFKRVLSTIKEMHTCLERSQKLQETVFVPFIAAYVPVKEQEVFNRRVIQKLGLLESQIHLVGMLEAIAGNSIEASLFEEQIPRVVQAAIPVWRRTVYVKRTACFTGQASAAATVGAEVAGHSEPWRKGGCRR